MIYFIIILLTIGLWACVYFTKDDYTLEVINFGCCVVGTLFTIIAIVMTSVIIGNNVASSSELAHDKEVYNSLVYQYESNLYDNDNDLGLKETMIEIQNWNSTLASHKELQRDFWVGIFYPNIYDELNFIELK